MQWFYARNDQQLGPVSPSDLQQLAQAGTILPETLVWKEGMESWQPFRTVSDQTAPARAGLPPVLDQGLCAECQRPFSRNDLLSLEKFLVCAACKPVFLQKLREGLMPGGSAAIWRSGKFLVMRKEASLPDRCVKCDGAASGEKLTRKLFWHHPALYLLIIPGLLIYAIIATIVGKRAKIQIGLCHPHRQRRKRSLLIAWGVFLSCIPLFIVGGTYGIGWIIFLGVIAMLAGPVYGMIACPMVTPKKIDDQFVWLNGVTPQYLETFGEFPGR
jgi:hypothetical protein